MPRVFLVTLLALYFGSHAVDQQIRLSFPGSPTTIQNFVSEVAAKSRGRGSLILEGECLANGEVVTPLVHPPEGPFKSLDGAFLELIHIDRRLSFVRQVNGRFSLRDNVATGDVLDIRLHRFRFHNALGAEDAVVQLLSAPEVKEYFTRHSIESGFVYNHLGGGASSLPAYNAELQYVTVGAALDMITSFYPGVWMYGECSQGTKRLVAVKAMMVTWPDAGRR